MHMTEPFRKPQSRLRKNENKETISAQVPAPSTKGSAVVPHPGLVVPSDEGFEAVLPLYQYTTCAHHHAVTLMVNDRQKMGDTELGDRLSGRMLAYHIVSNTPKRNGGRS